MEAAFEWAVKVANYVNDYISETNVQVVRNIGGSLFQVHWVANYESLAVFEEVMKRIEADSGYRELISEVREQQLLIGTSIVDSLYEAVL